MTWNAIRRFILLPPADRALVVRVGLLVGFVRVLLWTCSWCRVRRAMRMLPARLSSRFQPASIDRLVWAVLQASRVIPHATCLTQSLALQCALNAIDVDSSVVIGVRKDPGGVFLSHAWVEKDGRMFLDTSSDASRYIPMVILGPDLNPISAS